MTLRFDSSAFFRESVPHQRALNCIEHINKALKTHDSVALESLYTLQRKTPLETALRQLDACVELHRTDIFELVCSYTRELWRLFDRLLTAVLEAKQLELVSLFVTSLAEVEWSYRCTCFRRAEEEEQHALFMERRWIAIFEQLCRNESDESAMLFAQQLLEELAPPVATVQLFFKRRYPSFKHCQGSMFAALLQSFIDSRVLGNGYYGIEGEKGDPFFINDDDDNDFMQ